MQLWQAILIGCDRREQAFGSMKAHYNDGRCTSCALGAAYEGTFNNLPVLASLSYPVLIKKYQILNHQINNHTVIDEIIHLNDTERWTREKIALEFVKPIEDEIECLD